MMNIPADKHSPSCGVSAASFSNLEPRSDPGGLQDLQRTVSCLVRVQNTCYAARGSCLTVHSAGG